jgi:signal transduction histidine kinase
MLHEFLLAHRAEIIARPRERVSSRASPPATGPQLEPGISLFLAQLTETLQREQGTSTRLCNAQMGETAADHGGASRRRGVTVAQLIHDYGDVCQAVIGLALELGISISTDEIRTLNRCLDDAIAQAVTAYTRPPDAGSRRLGDFAHELRNLLSTSLVAFEVLKGGSVGVGGSTGALLGRSLLKLRDLVDRSLAEVRLEVATSHREHVGLSDLIEEVEIAGSIQATVAHCHLTVVPPETGIIIDVDRHMIAAVLDNLLINAFKFSVPAAHIVLRTDTASLTDRVLIEVEDQCGGLPPGRAEDLFNAFEQRGRDRSGLGLGLAIARESVLLNGGAIRVRDLPGRGCVFTVDLPRLPRPAEGVEPASPGRSPSHASGR